MKVRLWMALAACVVGATVVVGTAAADPPTVEEFSPVGEQFVCGETVLTISSGTVISRMHVHRLRSGRYRVIFVSTPKRVRATDEDGTVYRLVGSVRGNFTTRDPDVEGGEVGFFHFKINVIGPRGLFGTLNFRVQTKRNGDEVVRDRGTCEFIEP